MIGDLAALNGADGQPLPGVAPVAQQQARHAARNIVRSIEHQPLQPFVYHDPGTMATIGRAAAIAKLGRVHLSGLIGWLVWLVRAHHEPGRVPQPVDGADPVGWCVYLVPAQRAIDHRA